MALAQFDLLAGLNELVPGPRFQGQFTDHTEEEYNTLTWLDSREKPPYAEVEAHALNYMRRRIAEKIDERTQHAIIYEFVYNETPVFAPLDWQFDAQNLWLLRAGLDYPYKLKVGRNTDASSIYIEFADADALHSFYMSFFGYVKGWLDSGRDLKDSLKDMTRTQLEEFRDDR